MPCPRAAHPLAGGSRRGACQGCGPAAFKTRGATLGSKAGPASPCPCCRPHVCCQSLSLGLGHGKRQDHTKWGSYTQPNSANAQHCCAAAVRQQGGALGEGVALLLTHHAAEAHGDSELPYQASAAVLRAQARNSANGAAAAAAQAYALTQSVQVGMMQPVSCRLCGPAVRGARDGVVGATPPAPRPAGAPL